MPCVYYTPEFDRAYKILRINGIVYVNFSFEEYVLLISFYICYDYFCIGFDDVSFLKSSNVNIDFTDFYSIFYYFSSDTFYYIASIDFRPISALKL